MPTNKEISVMVYAHPYTLMQYICKTLTHLGMALPPSNENGEFLFISTFVIVLF